MSNENFHIEFVIAERILPDQPDPWLPVEKADAAAYAGSLISMPRVIPAGFLICSNNHPWNAVIPGPGQEKELLVEDISFSYDFLRGSLAIARNEENIRICFWEYSDLHVYRVEKDSIMLEELTTEQLKKPYLPPLVVKKEIWLTEIARASKQAIDFFHRLLFNSKLSGLAARNNAIKPVIGKIQLQMWENALEDLQKEITAIHKY